MTSVNIREIDNTGSETLESYTQTELDEIIKNIW